MGNTAQLGMRALEQIDAGVISEKGVSGLAQVLHITPRHLSRVVKAKTGMTPSMLDRVRRLREAKVLLQETKLPIIIVAFNCDFMSVRQFNNAFKMAYSMTPREMRSRVVNGHNK